MNSTENLNYLLSLVERIDVRQIAGVDDSTELRIKHHVVAIIKGLLQLVKRNNYDLGLINQTIYLFNGEHWKAIQPETFKYFLGSVALAMGIQEVDAKFYLFQDHLYKQFLASAVLPIPDRQVDTVLVNLNSGTYEVSTGGNRLRNFNSEDFLTYKLHFDYSPQATAPMFQQFLDRILPDRELQSLIAEFMGYVFIKSLKLHKCLLLFGSGANGKSVLWQVIRSLFGLENVTHFTLKDLAQEHNRAMIANKLLNYGSEIKGGIDFDDFKLLASGEPIQARLKYQNSVMLDDYAKLAFNCNELPSNVEHTEAFFRRFIIIPFNETIPIEEQDPELANKIINNELPGVFNWVLQGLQRIVENKKFSESSIATKMLETYKLESDSVYHFLQEFNYIPSTKEVVAFRELFQQYDKYCLSYKYRAVSAKKFSQRLKNHGYEVIRKGGGGNKYVCIEKKV